MRIHTAHTRDAALRQLSRLNRWLIAGSVLLTGALTEAAAHAFPGRTIERSAGAGTRAAPKAHADASGGATSDGATTPLKPPAQPPQAAGESTHPQEPAPAQESHAAQETTPEQAPESEAAPAQEAPPAETARESAPAPEPQPEPEPVVSGGS